ncbi:MAG: hypothetical protein RIB63_15575, partial [Fulvivirga sp.]
MNKTLVGFLVIFFSFISVHVLTAKEEAKVSTAVEQSLDDHTTDDSHNQEHGTAEEGGHEEAHMPP